MAKHKDPSARFFLIFGLLWLVLGSPFTLIGIYMLKLENRYANEGKKATAIVSGKKIESSRNKNNESVYTYLLDYTFADTTGRKIEAHNGVQSEFYNRTEIGSQVEVQYLPDSPDSNNRVMDGEEDENIVGWLFVGAGAITAIIGICSLAAFFKRYGRRKKLQRDGTAAQGEITAVRNGTMSINGVMQMQLHYKYTDHYGKTHTGISEHLSPEDANRWKAGDKGKVRFHKQKAEISMWEGE